MHRGRVTGFLRRTVVEVARYDRTTGEAIVLTPWPSQANWYQNVLKQPASEIWIAAERYRPWQRVLGPDEIAAVLDAYSEKSRLEAAGLRRLLGWGRGLPSDRRAELASLTGGVAFRRMKYE
jgi:hypothetical protein